MKQDNQIQKRFQMVLRITTQYQKETYSQPKRGKPYTYSIAWIMALVFAQRLLGIKQETTFLKMVPALLRISPTMLPEQSGYNKRVHLFAGVQADFFKWLLLRQPWWNQTKYLLIDSMPIEVKRLARKNTKGKFAWARTGYCASQNTYFFGYKLHTLATRKGFPVQFLVMPGNLHDVRFVYPLVLGLRDKEVVGDKGYASAKLFEQLVVEREIFLFTPPKENSKDSELCALGKQDMAHRKQIENLFSVLERMGMNNPGAKSDTGSHARISSAFGAIALMQVINHWNKEHKGLERILWN